MISKLLLTVAASTLLWAGAAAAQPAPPASPVTPAPGPTLTTPANPIVTAPALPATSATPNAGASTSDDPIGAAVQATGDPTGYSSRDTQTKSKKKAPKPHPGAPETGAPYGPPR